MTFYKALAMCLVVSSFISGCGTGINENEIEAVVVNMHSDLGFKPPKRKTISEEFNNKATQSSLSEKNVEAILPHNKIPDSKFNSDLNYQNLERYEFLTSFHRDSLNKKYYPTKGHEKKKLEKRDGIYKMEKPIVLAGKGFNIKTFEHHASGRIKMNPRRFLISRSPVIPEKALEEHMDPNDENLKAYRPIIFHSRATGFNSTIKQNHIQEAESSLKYQVPQARPISHSKVLMYREEKADVKLKPSLQKIDLLKGDQSINKRDFYNLPQ